MCSAAACVAQKQAMTERRVDAYIETIRREKTNPELVAMSDSELRDLLLSSAHNLKVQRDRRLICCSAALSSP